MRKLSIEAATPESGLALFDALRSFQPQLEYAHGRDQCVVSVELNGEDRTVEVLATLDEFVRGRHAPVTLTVSEKAEGAD